MTWLKKRKTGESKNAWVQYRINSPVYSLWNSPGQNTGVGSLEGSSPGLPHCRWILYQLNHKESPRILEWVACPFSRGSSWPRNQTGVSCIAGKFFTNWAIREAPWLTWRNYYVKVSSESFFFLSARSLFAHTRLYLTLEQYTILCS